MTSGNINCGGSLGSWNFWLPVRCAILMGPLNDAPSAGWKIGQNVGSHFLPPVSWENHVKSRYKWRFFMRNKSMNGGFSIPTIHYRRLIFLRHAKNHSPWLLGLLCPKLSPILRKWLQHQHGGVSKFGTNFYPMAHHLKSFPQCVIKEWPTYSGHMWPWGNRFHLLGVSVTLALYQVKPIPITSKSHPIVAGYLAIVIFPIFHISCLTWRNGETYHSIPSGNLT